jgi:hypothetical protein
VIQRNNQLITLESTLEIDIEREGFTHMRLVVTDIDLWAPRGLVPLASETTAGQAGCNQ